IAKRRRGRDTQPRRFWSRADDEFLRAHYKKYSADAIAAHLNRSRSAVHGRAQKIGVAISHALTSAERAELLALIRARHPRGWSDTEVTAEWSRLHPARPISRG